MSNQFAVVGSGSAPSKVIAEGLTDALDGDGAVGLIWTGKPTPGQEAVFDYVLDNEVEFTLYYEDGQNPPKVFRESDHGVVQKSRDPLGKALDDTTGSVLFLWDDDENPDLIEVVWGAVHQQGVPILELTNGLAPITLEEEEEEVTEAKNRYEEDDGEEEEEDDTRFTKDELEVMAAAAVKRYGARIGAEATTKKGIIEELFPDDAEEEHNAGHTERDGDEDEVDTSPENMRRTKGDPEADHEPPAEVRRPGSPDRLEQDIEEVLDVIRTFLTAAARGEYSN